MKDVMSVEEVARYLGFGVAKVYQLIEKKEIPASKIGKQYRFLRDAVNAWLSSNIIMEDSEFLTLLKSAKKEFKDAGYTQEDISQAVAQVKEEA